MTAAPTRSPFALALRAAEHAIRAVLLALMLLAAFVGPSRAADIAATRPTYVLVAPNNFSPLGFTSFPPAFDPARVVLEPWGVLTLKFLAPNQGLFAWSSAYPGFGSGTLKVDRLSVVSERASDRAGEMPSCASGTWFDVARPGQGFQVQKIAGVGNGPAQLVVIWYVYDQGQQYWLIGQGPVVGNQATVALVTTRGGTFPPLFNSAAVQQSPWGNLTFRFVDANRARVDWAPTAAGFTPGGYDLARLSTLSARPCR